MKAHCCWIRVSPLFVWVQLSCIWSRLISGLVSNLKAIRLDSFCRVYGSKNPETWTIHNHNFWNMMSLIWTGTHVNVLSKKNGLNMGHQTFLIMLSGFSVDFSGVMELWGLDISIEKPASQMTAAILMFKGPLTVSFWSIGRLEIASRHCPRLIRSYSKALLVCNTDHVFISTLKKRLQNRFDHSIHDWKIGNGGGASRWIGDWHHLSQFSKGLFQQFLYACRSRKERGARSLCFFVLNKRSQTPDDFNLESRGGACCQCSTSRLFIQGLVVIFLFDISDITVLVQQELRSCLELETEDRLPGEFASNFSPRCLACCPNQEPRGHKPRAGEKARGPLCEWTKSQLWYYGSFVKSFLDGQRLPPQKSAFRYFSTLCFHVEHSCTQMHMSILCNCINPFHSSIYIPYCTHSLLNPYIVFS